MLRGSPGLRSRITCWRWTRRVTPGSDGWLPLPLLRPEWKTSTRRCSPSSTNLLDAIAARGPNAVTDLVTDFTFPMPVAVICQMPGVPVTDRARLGTGLTTLLKPTNSPDEYAAAKQASDTVVSMLEQVVALKHDDPGDDLVTALIRARDGEERLTSRSCCRRSSS